MLLLLICCRRLSLSCIRLMLVCTLGMLTIFSLRCTHIVCCTHIDGQKLLPHTHSVHVSFRLRTVSIFFVCRLILCVLFLSSSTNKKMLQYARVCVCVWQQLHHMIESGVIWPVFLLTELIFCSLFVLRLWLRCSNCKWNREK